MHDVRHNEASQSAELSVLRQRVAALEAALAASPQPAGVVPGDYASARDSVGSATEVVLGKDMPGYCMPAPAAFAPDTCQHTEAALRSAEELYRGVVEYAGQGIVLQQHNYICYANRACAQMFGYDHPDALLGQPFWETLIFPDEWPVLKPRIAAHLRGERLPALRAWQGVRQDGSRFWVQSSCSVVTWQGCPAMLVFLLDVTERHQVEEALRDSESRYRTLVEGSLQGMLIVDQEHYLFVNPALAQMFGYDKPEEIIGQSGMSLVAPHDRPRIAAYQAARLRGEAMPSRYECQGLRQDGSLIWLECLATPITWEDTRASLVTMIDITERQRTEAERQRLKEQVQQAQKMEAIGTLAGGIAHDFNNLLAAILGYTELALYDVPQDSALRSNLQEVLTAGTRAKELVQQILTFSRQTELERQPVPLHRIVNEALRLLRATLPTTIDIRRYVAQDVGVVLANTTQMHQVLMNLCTNAEYAMRGTGGMLEVRVEAVDINQDFAAQHPPLLAGPHVRLTVRDTGSGMDTETMSRIFEPFYSTKRPGEGSGMGLAVVHGIITGHSGAITVQSAPGAGTTFSIYLPRMTTVVVREAPAQATAPHGKGCILFVDDEVALARLGQEMLERLGYEVVARTSSVEAWAAFQARPERFDLVITDQTMPNMTGEWLAGKLRCLRPDIPIILCTGFSHVMNADKAHALGIDALLMKPLVVQDLATAIQRLLRCRKV